MDVLEFNLRHLRVFTLVHDLRSFTRAAAAAYLTQPAVSQVVSQLERQLDCKLIDRSGGQVRATPHGDVLAQRAVKALDILANHRITMAQMKAMRALAATGSYAHAAGNLGLSSPSLHRAVRDLGFITGKSIVTKRGRGVLISDDGRKILRGFGLALAELEAGLSEIKALNGREVGRIAIGAMPLSRARILPSAVAAFHRQHAGVQIAVTEGSYRELIEPLRDGDLDILVGAMRGGFATDDILQIPLFDDRPAVFARAGHPLAGRADVAIEELSQEDWVMPGTATPLRQRWEAMFCDAGLEPPNVPVSSGSVLFIRELLCQTDLLTVLSPDQVITEKAAGLLVQVNGVMLQISRQIGLTHRRDWRPTPLQKRFLRCLEAAVKKEEEQD